MRLHRLDVAAFGPYAGPVSVDLDALTGHGIFLLTGPTGAGKTTVLDAICYALYGGVPGARQAAKRLRSDQACADVLTRVQLEVTLRGRRLRVTREPEQDRPKQRGSGMTTHKARGFLEEHTPAGWTAVSTRLDEIGHELESLLGMSREQFCQVVLLPQGDFATFLRSDADGRRVLLQRLFATDRFERVEQLLRDWRSTAARDRDAAQSAVDETLALLAEVAGNGEPPDDTDIVAWADDLRDGAHKRLLSATHEATAARAAMQRARSRHKHAEELTGRQQQHADAVARRLGLDDRRLDVLLAETELGAARRATRVVPLLAAAAEAANAEAAATASLAGARAGLADQPDPGHALAQETVATLSSRVVAIRTDVGALKALLKLESEAASRTTAAATHRTAALQAAEQAHEHERWLDSDDEARTSRAACLVTTRELALQVEPRRGAVDALVARRAAAVDRDALLAQHVVARDTLALLVDRAQDARQRLFDLREQRIAGMAGELADALVPGQACPVCGSDHHPDPAGRSSVTIASDAEAHAEGEWTVAEQERRNTESTVHSLAESLAAARAVAGGDDPVAGIDAALAAARAELRTAERADDQLPALIAASTSFDAERDRHQHDRSVCLQREQKEIAHAAEAQRFVETAAAELAAARGCDRSIAARADRLHRLAELVDSVVVSDRDARHAQEAAARARGAADNAAAGAGFRDTDDAADAARDDQHIAALDALISGFTAEEAAVKERLSDPTLVAAAAAAPIDVTTALVELEQVEATLRALDNEHHTATRAVAAVDRLHDQLIQRLAALQPLAAQCQTVSGLSRLADGTGADNERRMSLSSYVLAARLEQVAAAATARLLIMSSGRYSLVHTDERDTHNKRSGLGLAVVDGWTGQQRPTSTLSGGETFFASLSLALGLADVVAAESGAAPLETLFVDEGFGSLDEDSLDEVMSVLDGLRDGGRVVGIVSHVAELRQRIPAQLQVVKDPGGSSLRVG